MTNIPSEQDLIDRSNDKLFKGVMGLKPSAIEYMEEFCPEVANLIELDPLAQLFFPNSCIFAARRLF